MFNKRNLIVLGIGVWGVLLWLGFGWFKLGRSGLEVGQYINVNDASQTASKQSVDYMVEEVARGLYVPWSIIFTSSDRMVFTERSGSVRQIEKGILNKKPLHVFSEVSTGGEEGLMSVAADPDYKNNRYLYFSLAYPEGGQLYDKVVRFKDEGGALNQEKTIIDKIPAAQYHAGSRIKFGPDGNLYITTGDATDKNIAQDRNSLGGKILRLNADGSIPNDNPWAGSPVWSYGHRNPQGLDWSVTGEMYSSEHGPSVFDGPAGGDEINRIVKAGNYGWPLVSHERKKDGTISPMLLFTPAEAPASLLYYSGTAIPQWTGSWFFGALKGEGMVRFEVDSVDSGKIKGYEKLDIVKFGRIREITQSPEGFIYFSTSNMDGRGQVWVGDDKIYRIVPVN